MAVKECSINNPQAKKSLVDGWVSMEDNEQCNNLLAEEVNQLMDLEVLCNLKKLSIENDKDNDDERLGPRADPRPVHVKNGVV